MFYFERKNERKKIRLILRSFFDIFEMKEDRIMRENSKLEYKKTVTRTFLKTVSAYANYGEGEIIFGIDDDENIVGIENPKKECLNIENMINDNISPMPEYCLSINEKTKVITLKVFEGVYKPYLYNSTAYRRSDTSSVPVDRFELSRLVLEGDNKSFEELPSATQKLTFNILWTKLNELLNIKQVSKDVLKTLELYSDNNGYNKAAELLADDNTCPGIDIVRFGESISIILDRETVNHKSVLYQYDKALEQYRKYYQYEEITGSLREKKQLLPEEAFREAIANALVHRVWDVEAHINVSMFEDRIEITSPGGLPKGISLDEYLSGGLSIPRNPILCNVFLRLNMIERFGTGIRRIQESYVNSAIKPTFKVMDNSIKITLPLSSEESKLSSDEQIIDNLLRKYGNMSLSSSELASMAKMGKTKVVSLLNNMVENGYIQKKGKGRGTVYLKIK